MDNIQLAKKITILYDSMGCVWTRLHVAGKITQEEENLMWATARAWSDVMKELGIPSGEIINQLRGVGEWPRRTMPYDQEIWDAMK